ncbi:MAG: hypothetical protein JHC33_11455 [Ignisphaera sp.]|nr:hypothetical protein [Ignisphaera sp.]
MAVSARDFNNKKDVSVFTAYGVTEADLGTVLGYLPSNSLIVSEVIEIVTISGTASATISLNIAGTAIVANAVATVAAVLPSTVFKNIPLGGAIQVVAGSTAPATGSTVFNITIMYVEYNKTRGDLTRTS